MPNEQPLIKEKAIKQLVDTSGIDLPQGYLDFLRYRNNYFIEVDAGGEWGAGRFEIYMAENVIKTNKDLLVEEFLPGFFIFGGDGANELLAFDTREPQPWKVYMVPRIVMSEEDAVVIADSFESLIN